MCAAGSAVDATTYYGFKVSATGKTSSVSVNPLLFYFLNENSSLDTKTSSSSVSTPKLTVLNANTSLCGCENVFYKVKML